MSKIAFFPLQIFLKDSYNWVRARGEIEIIIKPEVQYAVASKYFHRYCTAKVLELANSFLQINKCLFSYFDRL